MAGETTTVTNAAADAIAQYMPNGRELAAHRETFEVTTGELELADIIQTIRLPKGALVVDGWIATDDLDSHACPTITLQVGTGDGPDGFLADNTVGQAAGMARFDGALLRDGTKLTADDTVDIKVGTAAATAAAGTITLCVMYVNGDDDL